MNFAQALRSAVVEKDVEATYRQAIRQHFHRIDSESRITSPHGSDGLLHVPATGLTVLMEFKYDLDFSKPLQVGTVLLQCMAYMRKIEAGGPPLPTIVLIGDINELFVVHCNDLIPFFEEGVDWSVAPSSIGGANPALALRIGEAVNPFIRPMGTDSDLTAALDYMVSLDQGTTKLIRLSEVNVSVAFEHFKRDVLKKSLGANEDVAVFIGVLTSRSDYYLHPAKRGILVANGVDVKVNGAKFESLFKHFDRDLSVREKEHLRSICDRLIVDEKRRRDGAFFTPTPWVDKAHAMIDEAYGENWREEFVVWDAACGTGNLTRDYRFKELYCSTLIQGELDTMVSGGVSDEAERFLFDFLNDDFDKVPEGLRRAFEGGRDVMFLINPPYGTSGSGHGSGNEKEGVAKTAMNAAMSDDGVGAAMKQLYAQFFYRIEKLRQQYDNRVVISVFSPSLYMTSGSFGAFRQKVLHPYGMKNGMVFQASHFADVSGAWGITFAMWDSLLEYEDVYPVKVATMCEEYILFDEVKIFYNLDGAEPASKWVREPIKGLKTFDAPQMSSALILKNDGKGKVVANHIGCFYTHANNVSESPQGVALFSSTYANPGGISITPANWDRVVTLFAGRKSIARDWLNWQDEYSAPDESHPDYPQFVADAHVYSLFNSKSQQSSLRQIQYKGETHDILNHFFWRSREEILNLADTHGFEAAYRDAKRSEDRYMATRLRSLIEAGALSDEAQAVLDAANAIYDASWQYRLSMHHEDESLHLNAWDAGWYQTKRIANVFVKDELKEFSKTYRVLEARMTEATYEVGFLRK